MNKLLPPLVVTFFIAIMLGCSSPPKQSSDPYNLQLEESEQELDLVE